MLILTRRLGQVFMVGNDVHIKVLRIKGKQVQLGIDAPTEIPVYRQEIYQKIKTEITVDAQALVENSNG